jgi:D-psicose/D-tagatose/L-ribulose 3-epimerase
MNPIGVCTWIWVSPFTDDDTGLVGHVKELGADVLELCIEDTTRVTADAILAAAGGSDIQFSLCGAFGPERDLSHEDPKFRRLGLDYVEFLVDLAAGIGAPTIVGPMYSASRPISSTPPSRRSSSATASATTTSACCSTRST